MSARNWAKMNEIIQAQETLNEELQQRLTAVEEGLGKLEKAAKKKASKKKEKGD